VIWRINSALIKDFDVPLKFSFQGIKNRHLEFGFYLKKYDFLKI
jgi:hypothetical protein